MPETEDIRPPNPVTFRGVRWLLLFVFYLSFLIPSVLELKWDRLFSFPMHDYVPMVAIQLFAVFAPCLVFIYLNSASFKESFNLHKITVSRGVMCALIGASAQSVATLLNIPMLMLMYALAGGLPDKAIQTPSGGEQLIAGLLAVAMLPAVFEELLMRGVVLSGTREKGYRASLIIGGLYFAVIHNQIENFPGHFFLGVLLCYIVWMTGSVWGGVIAHFSFNASGMVLDWLTSGADAQGTGAGDVIFWIATAALAALFFLLVGTINRRRVRRNKSDKLALQILFSLLNLPTLLVLGGYVLFQLIRYNA